MSVDLSKPAQERRPSRTVADFPPAVCRVDIRRPAPAPTFANPAAAQVADLEAMAAMFRRRAKVRTVSRAAARRFKSAARFAAIAFA